MQGLIPANLQHHGSRDSTWNQIACGRPVFPLLNLLAFHKPNSCLSGHQTTINHTSQQKEQKVFRACVLSLDLILQFLLFATYGIFIYALTIYSFS